MGNRQENPIYYRDFGYPNSKQRLVRMIPQPANIGDASAASFAELLSGSLVDIYIGPEKRRWTLHHNLVAYHSEQLRAELRRLSTKTQSRSSDDLSASPSTQSENLRLDLPDDDPAGFELLVKWQYQGKLQDVSTILEPQDKYAYAIACHRLHVLCDRLDMPRLKNMAMDQYRRGLNQSGLVPDADELAEIYARSGPGSPFRWLMTRIAARQIMDPDSEKDAESYRDAFAKNPDFAVELVNAIKEGTGGVLLDDPTEGEDCLYHDHETGPNCHSKGKAKIADSVFEPSTSTSTNDFHSALSSPPVSRPDTPTPPPRRTISSKMALTNGSPLNGRTQAEYLTGSLRIGVVQDISFPRQQTTDLLGRRPVSGQVNSAPPSTAGRRAPPKLVVRANKSP